VDTKQAETCQIEDEDLYRLEVEVPAESDATGGGFRISGLGFWVYLGLRV
jgi:hypothetical protein